MNTGRLHRLGALLALLALPLAACGSQRAGDGPGARDSRPADGQYVATAVTVGGDDRPLVKDSRLTLTIDGGQVMVNAGCNTMSGPATWSDDGLALGSLAMTEMGCARPLMDQDSWLAGVFTGTMTLSQDADGFTLTHGDTVIAFGRAAAAPTRSLTGTHWVLDSIGSGGSDGAVSSAPAGSRAWLQIDGDRLRLSAGCNTGSGTVDQQGTTLVVRVQAMTEMSCGEVVDRLESQLLAFFDNPVTFAIDGDSLTLTAADGSFLGFHAEDEAGPIAAGDYTSNGAPTPPFPDGGRIRLTLGEDGVVTFSAACNVMAAEATWADGVLRLQSKIVNQTTKPCSSRLAEQDSWLRDFFSSEPTLKLDGNDLRVRSGGTTIWLVPPGPGDDPTTTSPDRSLEGPRWLLSSVTETEGDSGSGMGAASGSRSAWIRLRGGRLQAFTGCNRASATYEAAEDTLTVGPLAMTKMACRDSADLGADLERAMLRVLGRTGSSGPSPATSCG